MIHKVGQRIGSLRKERNMSQEELATILNVSRQTVSKWETGDTLPDVYNAVALSNLFHVSLDSLILGSKTKYTNSSYMVELKDKRQQMNLKAIIVGGIGSVMFAVSMVYVKATHMPEPDSGYVAMVVLPLLMLLWGYAIWNFIKIGRIGQEIKYLENLELENIKNEQKSTQ